MAASGKIQHLGHKLAQAIKLKGAQQSEVAKAFGVSRPTVSGDWLKHGRIHKRHYPRLVDFFELPYEWWFGTPKRDVLREQLLYLYAGLSAGSRHELVVAANELYSKEHPDDRQAAPYPIPTPSEPKRPKTPIASVQRRPS